MSATATNEANIAVNNAVSVSNESNSASASAS
jgi:hypothetical protein